MLPSPLDRRLVLLLTLLFLGLWVSPAQSDHRPAPAKHAHRGPRPLRPRTPDDCPKCRDATVAPPATTACSVGPDAQRKSRRGRRKTVDTQGQACPNPDGDDHPVTDPASHALVGYGHPGRHHPIQDFYGQACPKTFSARRYTARDGLKTPAAQIAQVWHAMSEGLSVQAAARVFQLSQTTLRSGLTRAGLHARRLHDRLRRSRHLTPLQLDERRLQLHGPLDAGWLWVACDARTKLIPALALGARTQALAHQLVHEIVQRRAPGCVPVFSSEGLALYVYALTAPFGAWVQPANTRRRTWAVDRRLR